MVVEVVLHALNDLIILMPLSSNEDNIARLRHRACSTNGFTAVHNADNTASLTGIKPRQHIVYYLLRVFIARIIARENNTIAVPCSLLRHKRTLTLVAVTTGTAHRPALTTPLQYLVDGSKNISQSIGRMGIIHNSRHTLVRANRFKTTVHRLLSTEQYQSLLRLYAQHHCRTIHCKQIAYIETPYELHSHLLASHLQIHTLKTLVQDASLEVGSRMKRIRLHLRLAILHHNHTIAVVCIHHSKGILRQSIKESLLCIAIIVKRPMVVQMVTRKIRKNTTAETETTNTLLHHTMRAYLHKSIGTTLIGHLAQQAIQRNRIGRGALRRNRLTIDIIAHSTAQSTLIAKLTEKIVQDSCNSRLAIRSGYTNKMHPSAWVAKETRSQCPDNILSIWINKISNISRQRIRKLLAHHNSSTKLYSLCNKGMAIYLRTTHGNKDCSLLYATAINLDARHISIATTHHLQWLAILYQLL